MNSDDQIRFEDYLDRYGSLTYKNKGASMMPLLRQDRDLFTIEKKGAERCKKYDVVLYKDKHEHYILHRVIKVVPGGYIIRGDNTYIEEYKNEDEIIGIVSGFVRDGREIKVTDIGYRIYSVLRNASYPARYLYMKIRRTAGRVFKH